MTEQKAVWITGASSGIGEELARLMAAKGYSVAITARSKDKLESMASSHKNLHAYPGDVTKPGEMNAVVKALIKDMGKIDIAVLNAGTYFPDGIEDFTAAQFKKQYEINVFGTMHAAEPVLNYFKDQGRGHIAIVASVAGYRGLPQSLSYGSSKAALINFTESLATEVKGCDLDIKVQLVNPGFVKTPLTDKNEFEMPMLMDVDDAAAAFLKGLESKRFEITFPWMFAFILKCFGRFSPNGLYLNTVAKMKKKTKT